MTFRMRYYGRRYVMDLIPPSGKYFIGSNPTDKPQLKCPEAYIQPLHITLDLSESANSLTLNVDEGAEVENGTQISAQPRVYALGDNTRITLFDPADREQRVIIVFDKIEEPAPLSGPRNDQLNAQAKQTYADIIAPERGSVRLLSYLPGIYQAESWLWPTVNGQNGTNQSHQNFLSRYLALFESELLPMEWTITGFDLFLDPRSAPRAFLLWWEELFGSQERLPDPLRRRLLMDAYRIYALRGTRLGLHCLLHALTGVDCEIATGDDPTQGLPSNGVRVRIPRDGITLVQELIVPQIHSELTALEEHSLAIQIEEQIQSMVNEYMPAHVRLTELVLA